MTSFISACDRGSLGSLYLVNFRSSNVSFVIRWVCLFLLELVFHLLSIGVETADSDYFVDSKGISLKCQTTALYCLGLLI